MTKLSHTVLLTKTICVTNLQTLTLDTVGHQKQSVDVPLMIHHSREGKQHVYDAVQLLPIPKTRYSK